MLSRQLVRSDDEDDEKYGRGFGDRGTEAIEGDSQENKDRTKMDIRQRIALVARQAVKEATGMKKKKETRKAPKFQASILLGPDGFRLLRRLAHKMNVHSAEPLETPSESEGAETSHRNRRREQDLRHFDLIMSTYRDWMHRMYPKFKFRDLVVKTERLCRTAPLKAYRVALENAAREGLEFDEVTYAADQVIEESNKIVSVKQISDPPSPSHDYLDEDEGLYPSAYSTSDEEMESTPEHD
jgi:hypothetical protein